MFSLVSQKLSLRLCVYSCLSRLSLWCPAMDWRPVQATPRLLTMTGGKKHQAPFQPWKVEHVKVVDGCNKLQQLHKGISN